MIQTDTVAYFSGGRAFGHAQAKPATSESAGRAWDDEQLDGAASALTVGHDVHPDLLAALGRRYLDLVQDETTRAEEVRTLKQQLATAQGVGVALRNELVGERAESVRLAQLHAEASQLLALVTRQRDQAQYERTIALHGRAGTTPADIQVALARAARDTEVGR